MTNKLRYFRALNNITQGDLAESISVSRQTISAIEAGKYVPSTVIALKLAALFKVEVGELFELEAED